MREIKFRAWNKVTKEMVTNAINNCKDSFEMVLKHPQVYDVMQFTGLKDKNGTKIYEGDIVRMHFFFENYHPVTLGVFEDEEEIVCKLSITPLGVYFESDNMTGYLCDHLQEPSEELEVIGNIYDNKDLLQN